jgi:hypothetical protein
MENSAREVIDLLADCDVHREKLLEELRRWLAQCWKIIYRREPGARTSNPVAPFDDDFPALDDLNQRCRDQLNKLADRRTAKLN